jgi:hypothetical protein
MHHKVHMAVQHRARIAGYCNAPWRGFVTCDLTKIFANLCGVGINCADDLKRMLCSHQSSDGRANRPDAVLHDSDFFSHRVSIYFLAAIR